MDIFIKSHFQELIDKIKSGCPASLVTPEYPSVADSGCVAGTVLELGRKGEYYKFAVKALEPISPLFTSGNLIKAIEFVVGESWVQAARVLSILNEYNNLGIQVIYWTIYSWAKKHKIIDLPKISFNLPNVNLENINLRLSTLRHDPINVPIQIVNCGSNVVPSDWIGRVFSSGQELHSNIDTLEWRRGKPPVTYCCIYSMSPVDIITVQETKLIKQNNEIKIILELNSNTQANFLLNLSQVTTSHYIQIQDMGVFFNPQDHFTQNTNLKKISVGLASSTLQKCIRHGSCSVDQAIASALELAYAKPYNLPEQQFLKVSGSRQLTWRLFITCIEDFRFYQDLRYIGLLDLLALALITTKEPEYVLAEHLVTKITKLVQALCLADATTDYEEWKDYKDPGSDKLYFESTNIHQKTMYLADKYMGKMSGDGVMIRKYWSGLANKIKPREINPNPLKVTCPKCAHGLTPRYTGIDIHSTPSIILQMQALFPDKLSTQQISGLIWDLNSAYSIRKPQYITDQRQTKSNFVQVLKLLQQDYWGEYNCSISKPYEPYDSTYTYNLTINPIPSNPYIARVLFLKIFGRIQRIPAIKAKERVLEAIYSAHTTNGSNFEIKYAGTDSYLTGEDFNKALSRTKSYLSTHLITIPIPDCVSGYKWVFNSESKHLRIGLDPVTFNPIIWNGDNKFEPKPFDGSDLVVQDQITEYSKPTCIDVYILSRLLEPKPSNPIELFNVLKYVTTNKLSKSRILDIKNFIFDIQQINLLTNIWVKISTSFDGLVGLGSVTRSGDAMDVSIDYINEGRLSNIFVALTYCYPQTIKQTGQFKYKINFKSTQPMFQDIIRLVQPFSLKTLCCNPKGKDIPRSSLNLSNLTKPILKSTLWSHQSQTVDFILQGIMQGKRGFGDASNVGAGKTLSALATVYKLFVCPELSNQIKSNSVLVLVPSQALYTTWVSEAHKHFNGLKIILQNADGSLTKSLSKSKLNIVITTMGRNRSHPIDSTHWLMVIIDECLTVQNKEAIQTMEAWKQVVKSQFGCMLLSATFFRTRFDKLLYMLKMLQSGLPESKEFLDTVLCDSIKVNIPESKRHWETNLFKFKAPDAFYSGYEKIKSSGLPPDQTHAKLSNFIHTQIDYIQIFKKYLDQITKSSPKSRVLIYGKSKEEVERIANEIPRVGLYPDLSKTHVVVSLANGTYGLNNLVCCDQILSRPPEPDKLPQIKGRLDRPGQTADTLVYNYIIIDSTIENGDYLRLELCNNFYSNHIMPLSEYYKLTL